MKKFLGIMLTVVILLGCAVAASAQQGAAGYYENEVVSEDFETNNVWTNLGYNYQNQNQSAGITETHNVKSDSPDPEDGHGKVFRATIPKTNESDGNYTISEQHYVQTSKEIPAAEELFFTADVQMTARARLDIGFRVDNSTKWLTVARMWPDGRLTREDGTQMMQWNLDTWYSFKIYLDLENQTYSMIVNNTDCANHRPFVNTKDITYVNKLELTIQKTAVPNAIAEDSEYMYLDNINIRTAATQYSTSYTDDTAYNHVAFEETFDTDLAAANWQTISNVAYETVSDKKGSQSRALKATSGTNIRMNYSTSATTPILKNYTSEELERIKISFDFKVTEKGTAGTNFFNFRVYDAYSGQWPYLLQCHNNGYLYSLGSYQGNGIVTNPGYTVNEWSTAEIYIDAKNKKMSIDINGKRFMEDGPLSNAWGTYDVRVDSLQFEIGSGTAYIDNLKYEVMVPEIKLVEETNTAGTLSYTYSPDLLKLGEAKAPNAAVLLFVKKQNGRLTDVDIEPVAATKLLASELSDKAAYAKALTDSVIEARHNQTIKFDYEKGENETIEVFLWDSKDGLRAILPKLTVE